MKPKLFLCGPGFCGKSRLIRELLGERLRMAGGFCTELSRDEAGELLGCSLFPAAAAGGVAGFPKELFLDLRTFPPQHDSEVFRQTGTRLLEEAGWYPFAVLDELGGIDLIIPQFRTALAALLDSPLPILGVLKTRGDSETLRKTLGPGERFTAFYDLLYTRLSEDPETELITVTGDVDACAEPIRSWAACYTVSAF